MLIDFSNVYPRLTKWQDLHEINVVATQNSLNAVQAQYDNGEISEEDFAQQQGALFSIYDEEVSRLGTDFNFMLGRDSSNQESYMEQLGYLASGDFSSKDEDQDGLISRSEYIMGEVYDSVSELSPEQKAQAAVIASMAFDAINSLVLVDSNEENDVNAQDEFLDVKDFENFYKVLDGYNYHEDTDNVSFDGVFDGKINLNSFDAFLNENTTSVSDESKQEMYESFLKVFSE